MGRKKLHWFCFSYNGICLDNGLRASASIYIGYKNKDITQKIINDNKKIAGVEDSSVLIAVSYLSHMTKEDFTLI